MHVKRVTVIILIIIIFLIVSGLICESLGVFPGSSLNKIVVKNYLKENYPSLDYSFESTYFDKGNNRYVYACKAKEGSFDITAKGFKVIEDGYFKKYIQDNELIKSVSSEIEKLIKGHTSILSVEFYYPLKKGEYKSVQDVLDKLEGKYNLIVKIQGENITFDEYKALCYDYIEVLRDELKLKPIFLQVFYYRTETILQYESGIVSDIFYMDEKGVINSSNTHFYVELTDKQIRNYRIYSFFKRFYLVFLGAMVIFLITVRMTKKYKKNKKENTKKAP